MAASNEYRAVADECFRLAQSASTQQERVGHLNTALTLLRAATRYDDALPVLPPSPRLSTVLGVQACGEERCSKLDAARSARSLDDGTSDMLRAVLDAIPKGSTIMFSADQLGVLFSAGGPIVAATEASARVEHLAKSCGCSFSLQQGTGTGIFTKDT
jgi:hypothetical protein